MNKSTIQRSEEARRQAQAALAEAKRQQDQALQERASMHALDVRKIESLRAQRLAEGARIPEPDLKSVTAKRRQLTAA